MEKVDFSVINVLIILGPGFIQKDHNKEMNYVIVVQVRNLKKCCETQCDACINIVIDTQEKKLKQ